MSRIKRKEIELLTTIKQAYEKFNQSKLSKGMGKPGDMIYWSEIQYFLTSMDLCSDDYISVISESMFNDWVIKLRESALSAGSINHFIGTVRVFFYWAMREGLMNQFKINLIKAQEEPLKFIPDEDLKKLLEKPKTDVFAKHRAYVIVCFLLGTGCRASTLVNIKVEDIDFKSKQIYYRHSKNKSFHSIPLSPTLERVLTEYLETWELNNYLFPEVNDVQMSTGALRCLLTRYCHNKGVKRYGPHSFRHTMARLWILNGGNAFQLQHILGHSDLTMTKRYVRLFANDMMEDFRNYNPLDTLKSSKSRTLSIKKLF